MAVQVDQVTGVGTLIQTGDHVDVIVGFGGSTAGAPAVPASLDNIDPKTGLITPVSALGGSSVKMVVQSSKVVGTLLPPPPAAAANSGAAAGNAPSGTSLNGQQEIVLLEVTAQQAEVIRYGQVDGCLSLVLRSPKDLRRRFDAAEPGGAAARPDHGRDPQDPGRQYGVLPPQIIQVVIPPKK